MSTDDKDRIRPPSLGVERIEESDLTRLHLMDDMRFGYPRCIVLLPVKVDIDNADVSLQVQLVQPGGSTAARPYTLADLQAARWHVDPSSNTGGSYTLKMPRALWPTGGNHVLALLYFNQQLEFPDASTIAKAVSRCLHAAAGLKLLRHGLMPEFRAERTASVPAPESGAADAAAAPAAPRPLSFVLASCQYPHDVLDRSPDPDPDGGSLPGPPDASMVEMARVFTGPAAPQVLIQCGDQVYVDATAGLFEPTTLYDRFRRPYTLLRQSRGHVDLQRHLPTRVHRLIDDHEIVDNWAPGDPGQEADFKAGLDAYFEFQRFEDPGFQWPPTYDYATHGGHEFFLADSRTLREPRRAADYTSKLILGADQEAALHAWLEHHASAERPRFVATASMLLPRPLLMRSDPHAALHVDGWCGYPRSLYGLLALIARLRMKNLVFLSGDEHLSGVARIDLSKGKEHLSTLWSIHSSAMYAPYPFANAREADFADDERFDFTDPADSAVALTCSVRMRFAPKGDGFAVITAVAGDGDEPFVVEWHRPRPQTLHRINDGNHNASG